MKFLFRISLVILLQFASFGVYAQPSGTAPNKVYGLEEQVIDKPQQN